MLHSEGMKQRDLKKSLLLNLIRDKTKKAPSGSSTLVAHEGGFVSKEKGFIQSRKNEHPLILSGTRTRIHRLRTMIHYINPACQNDGTT